MGRHNCAAELQEDAFELLLREEDDSAVRPQTLQSAEASHLSQHGEVQMHCISIAGGCQCVVQSDRQT